MLPGLTLTRSLNGAAEGATVSPSVVTIASRGKRGNLRDPNGKLSDETAPVLLTRVDYRQPFTLVAREYPGQIWMGLSSQSRVGEGNSGRFDQVSLTRTSIVHFRMGK